ncbi:sugar kinase [Candidatus Micrarchaeota archaeon]|nr:sugar kinase [Candidatus Micrarchaeota archaeon]
MALDTTRTPFRTVERVLGGACSYFSLAANFFTKVYSVSVIGEDFPRAYLELLSSKGIDLGNVQRIEGGKTFFYDSTFSFDLYHRQANKTELNVLAEFDPRVDGKANESEFLYLATMPPQKQLKTIRQMKGRKLVFMDTIEFYIQSELDGIKEVMKNVDGVVLNDSEARMLAGENNLIKCGKKIQGFGPKIVILKKGEHGSLLFYDGQVVPFPAYPLEDISDPTGAGDAFAGGFLGYLARERAEKPGLNQMKKAMAYANVMGSLTVEEFSVDGLISASFEKVQKRFEHYSELLRI